jgi:ribA/ribD-fused uncharacterized protein
MASGFPLRVNDLLIPSSEALYQACRFPDQPELQRLIISQANPMTAKAATRPHIESTRPDWQRVRVAIMRWSLQVKLACNWDKFGRLLSETEDRPIVEDSRRDDFWGAVPQADGILVGMNVLGRLLMELREHFNSTDCEALRQVQPLSIPQFNLLGSPIRSFGDAEPCQGQLAL